MDVLSTRNVTKSYGGVHALQGVSVDIPRGRITGLIGPNGSGKTTFLNCLSGVLTPTSGQVRLDGRNITGTKPSRVAGLGISRTFQNIRLFRRLSARENVAVAALAHGASARASHVIADALLHDVGIGQLADADAEALSYGDRRRVEIARALASEPRFLLLDEPAAGMNDVESEALGVHLEEIRSSRGCGILMVDHDLQLMMRRCDWIHVLNEGREIAAGTPAEIRADEAVITAYIGAALDDE